MLVPPPLGVTVTVTVCVPLGVTVTVTVSVLPPLLVTVGDPVEVTVTVCVVERLGHRLRRARDWVTVVVEPGAVSVTVWVTVEPPRVTPSRSSSRSP